MGADQKAIGFLELNSKQFTDACALAEKALVTLGAAFAVFKTVDFWKEGIEGAIRFGNEAYFAAQKLNGFDAGNLLLVQKALERSGQSAQQATDNIENFGRAGRPLEQLFKGGSSGFGQALTEAAKEYGTQGAVLSKSAEEFAFVEQQIIDIGTKMRGFFLGLADQIARPLSGLLEQIDKIDLVSMGEKFGGYIVTAINTVRGLMANKSLFEIAGLAFKVGLENAVDYLESSSTWAGIAKIAIGALGIIGTFLTNIFLGIGKILVAVIQSALAQLTEPYRMFLKYSSVGGYFLERALPSFSKDVGQNLNNINNNSSIQSANALTSGINASSMKMAMSGLEDLFKKNPLGPTSQKDQDNLFRLLNQAAKAGESLVTPRGKKTPTFSETADPFHVIADSLAKVGGGGRYVRTGLSIAEKAAMDAARFNKQQADIQMKYLPFLKNIGKPQTVGGG